MLTLQFLKWLHPAWNLKLLYKKLFTNVEYISFILSFTEECKYITKDPNNQGDINKLLGLRASLFSADNACMIGWAYNPTTDLFDVYIYIHNGGTKYLQETLIDYRTSFVKIASLKVGEELPIKIEDYLSMVVVSWGNISKEVVFKDKAGSYETLIIGHFGGQSTPSKNFSIKLKDFKIY